MIMEQLMREKLLTVKKEMEGFMKESVPFWLENGIDKEYGGYLVCYDSKGKLMKELAVLTPEDKMIVTQTRMIWGFSALLRNGLAKRYGWEEKCKGLSVNQFPIIQDISLPVCYPCPAGVLLIPEFINEEIYTLFCCFFAFFFPAITFCNLCVS